MKYTVSVEIALPRQRVAELLEDPAHFPKWLRGLVLHEPIRGAHGRAGTTSRVVMQMGKQQIECTETITRREPVDLRAVPWSHLSCRAPSASSRGSTCAISRLSPRTARMFVTPRADRRSFERVAHRLHVAEATAKRHISNLFAELQCRDPGAAFARPALPSQFAVT